MDGEDEKFAHGANGTITTGTCKTARRRRIASHCEFAPHRYGLRHNIKSKIALGDVSINRERAPHDAICAGWRLRQRGFQQRGIRAVHLVVSLVPLLAVTIQ